MDTERSLPTIGILNAAEGMVDVLQAFLREEGYDSSVASIADLKHGRQDAPAWLAALAPTAILYDIPRPTRRTGAFYQWACALPAAARHWSIVTTPNERRLERLIGPVEAIELAGESFDLGEILDRLELALAAIEPATEVPAG